MSHFSTVANFLLSISLFRKSICTRAYGTSSEWCHCRCSLRRLAENQIVILENDTDRDSCLATLLRSKILKSCVISLRLRK